MRVEATSTTSAAALSIYETWSGAFIGTLMRYDGSRYRGIVGLVTDLRLERRRGNAAGDGMNLFVAGAIEACGRICWSVDEAVEALRELESQPR